MYWHIVYTCMFTTQQYLFTGKPLELQSYAENMIDSVLMPVADGAKHLGTEDQVAALATVVDGMCKTWSHYFLKNKIRIR